MSDVADRRFDVDSARHRTDDLVACTPVVESAELSVVCGGPVVLKLENLQHTGSFKVRGAANKILSLSESDRRRGVVTCSSGNHGRAVAFVAERLDIPAVICVPEWVDPVKLEAIRAHGAETVFGGATYDEAEQVSFRIRDERGLVYVHPFDDPQVVAGQGTIGLELLEQVQGLRVVLVPLSGGGLIAGIAMALKDHDPSIQVIAVSAENARVMYESQLAGRPIAADEDETIATALSGGIGSPNEYTFDLVRDYVDEHVLVTEDEIRAAMRFASEHHRVVAEGGGATGLAALVSGKVALHGRSAVVVVSGGNVDPTVLAGVLVASPHDQPRSDKQHPQPDRFR